MNATVTLGSTIFHGKWRLLSEILMIRYSAAHALRIESKIAGRDVYRMQSRLAPLMIMFLLLIEMASPIVAFAQPQIPFEGLQLTYFS